MSEESSNPGPRDIFSTRPFWHSSREYYRKGFLPFPLPAKEKNPPPEGVTGHNPKVEVDVDQIDIWMDDSKYTKSNVGVKFDLVRVKGREEVPDGEYIVLGIDVDNYDDYVTVDGEKKLKRKEGGAQLEELEERFGKLPETWISSARADGVSGIRFFLAPTDLQWRGKAADSIDVIQPGHRFAVVWPSWHPEGGQYLFTQPGQVPDGTLPNLVGYRATTAKLKPGQATGKGRAVSWTEEPVRIPDARELPLLPEKWVNFLTRDKTAFVDMPMNMDLSVDEMERWAKAHMRKGKPCKELKARVTHWKERIEGDPASHDKVLGFHWQLAQMGLAEGHTGCSSAIKEMNDFWMKAVQKAGKRGPSSAAAEIFRSKINAYRKVRYLVDEMDKVGAVPPKTCRCAPEIDQEEILERADKANLPRPAGQINEIEDYSFNDWGRAKMFLDMYTLERVKCVGSQGSEVLWYFWELDGSPTRKSRGWVQNNDLARRLINTMEDVFNTKVEQLFLQWKKLRETNPEEAKVLREDRLRPARQQALQLGSLSTRRSLLASAESFEGVRVPNEFFDSNESLLGFEDGVVELERGKPWHFRPVKMEDQVTKTTGLPFRTIDQLTKANDPGVKLLADYLNMFIPDPELATFVQMILGYSLYGSNPERKIFFFYGESSCGKSTILESFVEALGDYGGTSNAEIFSDENGGRNPELLKTRGKRMIQLPEFGESNHVSSDVLKRLASEDSNSVRDNFAKSTDIVSFQQSATFIGPANGVFKMSTVVDTAVRFRTIVVPFDHKFEETAKNKNKTKLMRTVGRAAILAWALEGWNKFVAGGEEAFEKDKLPVIVKTTTANFLGQMSAAGDFFTDYVERTDDSEDILTTNALYERYVRWAEREGIQSKDVRTNTWLTRQFNTHHGVPGTKKKTTRGDGTFRYWEGFRFKNRKSALKNSPFTVADPTGRKVQVGGEPKD